MTAGTGAAERGRVVGRVALVAGVPARPVRMLGPGIDREAGRRVHVMGSAERRRGRPGRLCVAGCARMTQVHRAVIRWCRRSGEIGLMALVTARERELVVAVRVAEVAGLAHMRPGEREAGGAVIERGRRPCRGRMALRARVRKLIGAVIRIRRSAEIRLMTRVAVGVHERIVAVRMTGVARLRQMRPGEREIRAAVIERGWLPGRLRMTTQTRVRELIRRVIGSICAVEIRLMTHEAVAVDELIVAVRVAVLTGARRVRPLQGEIRRRMIKRGRTPMRLRVTGQALVGELAGHVIRIRRVVERGLMTLPAVCVRERVIAVRVAVLTRHRDVPALQWELRGRVIERARLVRRGVVAHRAVVRHLPADVIRVLRLVETCLMALPAVRVLQRVIAVGMAILARRGDVRAGERELRGRMTEGGGLPSVHRMALQTVASEFAGHMVRRLGRIELRLMTLEAIHILQRVISIDVAIQAGHRSVRAQQRELGCCVVEGGRLPRRGAVALRTVVAEFPRHVVGILRKGEVLRVALLAVRVGDRVIAVRVAGLAGRRLVLARERKGRLVVIELRRLPCRGRVAHGTIVRELAGNVIRVRRAVVVVLMALIAVHVGNGCIVSVRVALLARRRQMPPFERKLRRSVAEGRRFPGRHAMALRAVAREYPDCVIRALCCREVGLMALEAVRVLQIVIPANVTFLAGLRVVRAGQRECGGLVVEGGRLPRVAAVALRAIVRELRVRVIGCLHAVVLRLMALPAIGIRQVVIAIRVAAFAGNGLMLSGERELRCRVIEGRRFPGGVAVAARAVVREFPRNVIRRLCGGEVLLMALPAVGVLQFVVARDVAILAGSRAVRAIQRELRCRMIET